MRRPRTDAVESAAAAGAVAASIGVLLYRLAPDVGSKPFFVDEAVAGLTATLPLVELVEVVVADRGGAPGHFVLTHLVYAFDASAESLRWLSVACAAATVALAFDLARRLEGRLAGVGAAAVVATSPLLGVYGSFGRMYALFALVGALAADLGVRALDARTTASAVAAGVAVALLPLVHPYGLLPAAVVAGAAAIRWRRRPFHLSALAAAAALVAVPVVVASLRLSDRFGVARHARAPLLSPSETLDYFWRTLGDFSAARGAAVLVPVALAIAGALALRESRRTFVVVALLALALPFVLLAALPTGRPQGLANVSTRHLIYALPCYAALVGVGAMALLKRFPRPVVLAAGALLAAFLALAGARGIADPRTSSELAHVTNRPTVLAEPARWLGENTRDGDLLFFGSPVYLEALPATRRGRLLDAAPGGILGRTLDRVEFPVPGAVVTLPIGRAEVELAPLARLDRADVYVTDAWVVIRVLGPLASARAALARLHEAWVAGVDAVPSPSRRLRAHLRNNEANLCGALRRSGGECSGSVPP